MNSDPIVNIKHLRKIGACSRGARTWCKRFGLNYMTFVVDGYPASVIEATGDALGKRIANVARLEAAELPGV